MDELIRWSHTRMLGVGWWWDIDTVLLGFTLNGHQSQVHWYCGIINGMSKVYSWFCIWTAILDVWPGAWHGSRAQPEVMICKCCYDRQLWVLVVKNLVKRLFESNPTQVESQYIKSFWKEGMLFLHKTLKVCHSKIMTGSHETDLFGKMVSLLDSFIAKKNSDRRSTKENWQTEFWM